MDWPAVRGFNYQPSYGTCGLDLWQRFCPETIERELRRGLAYFPRMNALRLWLSWDAFLRDRRRFAACFEQALDIADRLGLVVMPVLFNRWHASELDYGGIYIEHFLPGAGWLPFEAGFAPYLECVVGGHRNDERIFAWDLCNEPFAYPSPPAALPEVVIRSEYAWLRRLHDTCKQLGARAPITIGLTTLEGVAGLEQVEPICDILSIHPYWMPHEDKRAFEALLDGYVTFARRVHKPLLATETCWGSLDDAERVAIIHYTLSQLRDRGIGWLAYLLHHSLIADAHRPEYGPVGAAGTLAFIEADGQLRPGHDAFNLY